MKSVEREIKDLKKTIEVIIKVYKKRLNYIEKRKSALRLFSSNHGDFLYIGEKEGHDKLRLILSRERGLLKIVTHPKGVFDRESKIEYVYESFNRIIDWMKHGGEIKPLMIKNPQLLKLLEDVVLFVKRMERELKNIEERMELEEAFLKEKNQKSFLKFLKEWKHEIEYNELMIQDFKIILKQNATLIRKYHKIRTPLTIAASLGDLAVFFIRRMIPFFSKELADDKEIKELINKIEEY